MDNLIPNLSFILMSAIFIAIATFINYFIFKPVLIIIEQRKKLTVERIQESNNKIEEAKKMQIDYLNKLHQGRLQGIKNKEKIKNEGTLQANEILQQARIELEQALKAARGDVASQVETCRLELKSKAGQLAVKMTQKLLNQAN